MPKKSFVSISFTHTKLQVVRLSSDKKSVIKAATYDIPQGVINNYQVAQKEKLTEIIKRAWDENKISEKSVGIVVPEFSTYLKTLKLPKISTQDLNEAVRWQSQDFFATASQDMVLDWKIVSQDERDYTVLTVAIQKDILSGYVDAVSGAKLYPLVVETPSLSLVRIAGPHPSGKLILYVTTQDALLLVAVGDNIIASSVIGSGDTLSVLSTARQIASHYQEIGLQEVLIGGTSITQEMLDGLSSIGKVDWIMPFINGLTPQQIQEYLVPISLQFKDPAEPRSEATINLLPERWVAQYQKQRKMIQLQTLILISSLTVWACFLFAFGTNSYLNNQINLLKDKVNTTETVTNGENGSDIKKTEEINAFVKKIDTILSSSMSPQETINKINEAKPEGITINSYQIDFETGVARIQGKAQNRQSLIDLKRDLENLENFEEVQIPIGSLVGEGELNFEATVTMQQSLNKKKTNVKLQLN